MGSPTFASAFVQRLHLRHTPIPGLAGGAPRLPRRVRALLRAGRPRAGRPSTLDPESAPRGLWLPSLAALALPVVGVLALPEEAGAFHACLWLLALLPALLLAYYRGWRAAGGYLGAAVGVLAVTLAVAPGGRAGGGGALPWTLATYAGIAAAVGLLAELLRRERKRAIRLALTDDLTGLPNRRSARWFLDKEFAAAERGRPVAVVLLDLDHFKRYNDRHGHPAGDAALRAMGRVLDRLTRRMNLSARYGGEEFVCVLSSAGADEALVFVRKLRAALRAAAIPAGPVTVSAGVAAYDPDMRSPDDLLAAADRALYRAKRDGGDCVRVAAPDLDAAVASP